MKHYVFENNMNNQIDNNAPERNEKGASIRHILINN